MFKSSKQKSSITLIILILNLIGFVGLKAQGQSKNDAIKIKELQVKLEDCNQRYKDQIRQEVDLEKTIELLEKEIDSLEREWINQDKTIDRIESQLRESRDSVIELEAEQKEGLAREDRIKRVMEQLDGLNQKVLQLEDEKSALKLQLNQKPKLSKGQERKLAEADSVREEVNKMLQISKDYLNELKVKSKVSRYEVEGLIRNLEIIEIFQPQETSAMLSELNGLSQVFKALDEADQILLSKPNSNEIKNCLSRLTQSSAKASEFAAVKREVNRKEVLLRAYTEFYQEKYNDLIFINNFPSQETVTTEINAILNDYRKINGHSMYVDYPLIYKALQSLVDEEKPKGSRMILEKIEN